LRILRAQQADGSWRYPGGNDSIRSQKNYNQLETYRNLRVLVEKYGFYRTHHSIEEAVGFLFGFQTDEGDFRGIYGSQYTPNYSAAIMEILVKAGYGKDKRIQKGLEWLLSVRQDDGGWAIPIRTRGEKLDIITARHKGAPIQPDRYKPSAHLVTGIVLRAFASHPVYRNCIEARKAGDLLKSRFFRKDSYPDHVSENYWYKFGYPFWWTDLISSLDSLSKLGFERGDADIARGLKWFVNNQMKNGMWKVKYGNPKDPDMEQWVALAACRVFKTFYS
jgi:hypothetical protein